MLTVHELAKIAGVSIRTLQYYDKIGLLAPSSYTNAGYRLYDDTDIKRLQQIMLFRELEFPLKDIKTIINSPDFDTNKALEQQIELLTLKKEHLNNLIKLARDIKTKGDNYMSFKAFDTSKIDEYSKKAKESWGNTEEYKEFASKDKDRSMQDKKILADNMMKIFEKFGKVKDGDPSSSEAQDLAKELHSYINDNFYSCSKEVFKNLGGMYAEENAFSTNIDEAGGKGTAKFASEAVAIYCK